MKNRDNIYLEELIKEKNDMYFYELFLKNF